MSATENVCYKIRDRSTGLWSSGGICPSFSKKGKAWAGRGPLLNHLAQHCVNGNRYSAQRDIPSNWEVVTFRVTVSSEQGDVMSARDMYEKHEASK